MLKPSPEISVFKQWTCLMFKTDWNLFVIAIYSTDPDTIPLLTYSVCNRNMLTLQSPTILSLKIFQLQEIQMKFMDGRIKLMNEILNGIKILKFYAWEKAFLEQVLGYREKELKALKKSQILYSISIASFNSSSFLVCSRDNDSNVNHFAAIHYKQVGFFCSFYSQIAFAMFGVYVLIDDKNVLDAQKIFVSMALINILKTPLSQLPFAMSTTMQV